MENTSGQGRTSAVPAEIKGWNWGAFWLNVIWAISNRTWIGLLSLVPYAGIIMVIILGFKGNEWAWKNKRWESIDHFKSVQKKWSLWGVGLFIVAITFFTGFFMLAFRTGEPIAEKHLESVDWLPSGAKDISYYERKGFGWIKNYDCLIPEDDFLELAEKEGWKLQAEKNVLFYENRYPNGGGVTVNYDTDLQRLSVKSSHR